MNDDSTPSDHGTDLQASREGLWRRLERLVDTASSSGLQRLSDRDIEEVGKLYRAASTHLALLQEFGASVRQRDRLNAVVSRAHSLLYGRPPAGRGPRVLLWSLLAFAETVRQTLRYHVAAAALLVLGGVYGYFGAARDPDWTLEFVAPQDTRTPYASTEELRDTLLSGRPGQKDEYDEGAKAMFAAFLWQNNTKVALLSFFGGFFAGLPTVLVLLLNGAMLGVYTHTFHSHGLAWEWWAWILPHGVTELLAIVLLAGGGLCVGHRVVAPGQVSRVEALRRLRPHAIRLALFAFPMLLLAALIESFVRQSGLSDESRYVFAAATAVFWAAYLGFARLPRSVRARAEAQRTVAERAVPLPVEEELLGALR